MSGPLPPRQAPAESPTITRRLRVSGQVQGVGFRPFVYRLARELGLAGSVQNLLGEVEIVIQGPSRGVERFSRDLIDRAPAFARPRLSKAEPAEREPLRDFVILESTPGQHTPICVPPDTFACADCLGELVRATDRRHRYPFINCTQCGPRYTLIEALPYDRPNTSMSAFALCTGCGREYGDPLDRRFHAEPIACSACGPRVWLEEPGAAGEHAGLGRRTARDERALARAIELLRSGAIVAMKGVGGYHLLCDAKNGAAVERLRMRKRRPHKPLAVLFPQEGAQGVDAVYREVILSNAEAQLLASPARPIVLARKRPDATLAPAVAPGLGEVGVFLPCSPLHHLLVMDFGGPLIATSGNVSGEPVMTDVEEVRARLSGVADAFLQHDRPIARPADDSVVRVTLGRPRTIRVGRGLAPLELALPSRVPKPVLATGGHLKNTIALAWDDRVAISPHIGDMGTARGERVFARTVRDLQRLYGVRAEQIVCDAHPDYATSRWAEQSGMPVAPVLHHHAHASALAGEHQPEEPMLVFAWDGVGMGADRTLWGGETFVGTPGRWRRIASLRPFRLPGGERAAREPWRAAVALCWELGREWPGPQAGGPLREAWRKRINSPQTSSVGRLFDAAAAMLLGCTTVSFEGQGPMLLEAAAARAARELPSDWAEAHAPLPFQGDAEGVLRIDWQPLVSVLAGPASKSRLAAQFHATLAATITAIAELERRSSRIARVGLTGGVFQNALLAELAHARLTSAGFDVCLAERVPCNDGGLSYGQIIEFAARSRTGA